MVTIVTMYSPDDRTARAVIRDTAIELFGREGVHAVPLRRIAEAAGVSQALVVKHFGGRDGLIAAADAHVLGIAEALLADAARRGADPTEPDQIGSPMSQALAGSPAGAYLTHVLTGEGTRAQAAFDRLAAFARALIEELDGSGHIGDTTDRDDLAIMLLAHDLSALFLRRRIEHARGFDPLQGRGAGRWAAVARDLYAGRALLTERGE